MCSTFGKMVSARGAGTLSAVWFFSLLACGVCVGVWRVRVACGAGAGAPHAPGRERKAWSCSEHEPSGPPSAAAAVPWAPRRLRPALAGRTSHRGSSEGRGGPRAAFRGDSRSWKRHQRRGSRRRWHFGRAWRSSDFVVTSREHGSDREAAQWGFRSDLSSILTRCVTLGDVPNSPGLWFLHQPVWGARRCRGFAPRATWGKKAGRCAARRGPSLTPLPLPASRCTPAVSCALSGCASRFSFVRLLAGPQPPAAEFR